MHVRMQPTVDDFESALSALIDHSVAVCEGIPAIEAVEKWLVETEVLMRESLIL